MFVKVTPLGAPTVAASALEPAQPDRKSTRLNSSHDQISYAVFCLKKKKKHLQRNSNSKGGRPPVRSDRHPYRLECRARTAYNFVTAVEVQVGAERRARPV